MKNRKKFFSSNFPVKNPAKIRWMAWILLCVLSVFFSEVVSGNSPSVFINIYGLLITTPLYFLHLMVLLPLIVRIGKPGLGSLYLAGALFGLYEAFITKVIWTAPAGLTDWHIGGVAVFTTVLLVLFWHPVMSMIVPLFAADGLLNSHKTFKIRLPFQRLSRLKPVFLFAVLGGTMGLIHGAAVAKPVPALFSAVSSTLIIWLLIRLWKKMTGGVSYSLVQLMPRPSQWKIFVFLLAAAYIVLSVVLRPAAFPSLPGYITVSVMYLIIGGLLILSRKVDLKTFTYSDEPPEPAAYLNLSPKNWLVFSGGFICLSFVASMLQYWARDGIHYMVWGLGIAAGLAMFGWVVYRGIQKSEIHIKFLDFRRVFPFIKGKNKPAAGSGILQKIRNVRFRLPKINLNFRAWIRKPSVLAKFRRVVKTQR